MHSHDAPTIKTKRNINHKDCLSTFLEYNIKKIRTFVCRHFAVLREFYLRIDLVIMKVM